MGYTHSNMGWLEAAGSDIRLHSGSLADKAHRVGLAARLSPSNGGTSLCPSSGLRCSSVNQGDDTSSNLLEAGWGTRRE